MKTTGASSLILVTSQHLFDAEQNQIRDSGDIDSATLTNLSNEHGAMIVKSNSKYIEILNKYSICELTNNSIIKLIDPKAINEIAQRPLQIMKSIQINLNFN